MQKSEAKRLGIELGRLLVGVLWVVVAGVAGAMGAAHAQARSQSRMEAEASVSLIVAAASRRA